MRVIFYALIAGAMCAFMVGCADLDYVDDYADDSFYYDDGDEYVEIIDDDEEYAQDSLANEALDEEVVEIATEMNKKEVAKEIQSAQKSQVAKPTKEIQTPQESIKPKQEPQATPKAKSPIATEDSKDLRPTIISAPKTPNTPKITPPTQKFATQATPKGKAIYGKGFKGLAQSTAKLQASCENSGDLQKCEDLARIYALKDNINSALPYYEVACNNGGGSLLSCFFLSKIYENNDEDDTAQGYADMLGGRTTKVSNTELNLATGKIDVAKRNLKMSCSSGNESSCNALQSIFKLRGERSEMRTYFGTECWRGSEMGCAILRAM